MPSLVLPCLALTKGEGLGGMSSDKQQQSAGGCEGNKQEAGTRKEELEILVIRQERSANPRGRRGQNSGFRCRSASARIRLRCIGKR